LRKPATAPITASPKVQTSTQFGGFSCRGA
jgi:hypothetical protein